MSYTKHFLKGIDSVLFPTLDPFRFPSPITHYIQPHFLAALKYLRSSYGTEIARQKKASKTTSSKEPTDS